MGGGVLGADGVWVTELVGSCFFLRELFSCDVIGFLRLLLCVIIVICVRRKGTANPSRWMQMMIFKI